MAGEAPAPRWHELVIAALKENEVKLVVYVPDNVLRPLLEAIHADPYFTCFPVAREEEGLGIVCGAWMAGMRGVLLMQTSGFATLANVLASLPCAAQIPALMIVSERGTMGEFNLGQSLVWRTMRPVLDAVAVNHQTITRLDECLFIAERTMRQAFSTQAPACIILSALLTGGKVVKR
ncbi:MAG: hypothetical protein ACKVPY_07255 [Paracoccaceae bacterium]